MIFVLAADSKISDEALLFFRLIGNFLLTKGPCFAIKSYFCRLIFHPVLPCVLIYSNFIFLFFNISKVRKTSITSLSFNIPDIRTSGLLFLTAEFSFLLLLYLIICRSCMKLRIRRRKYF